MKTKLLFLAVGLLSFPAFAQEKPAVNVPVPVLNAFKAKFPKVGNPTWETEKAGEYEVDYQANGIAQSSTFDKTGKWLETETDLKITELPKAVSQSVAKNFPAFKITEAGKVESAKHGNCFEVEIQKGKESYDVLLNPNGEVLRKEFETSEKDDDK